MVTTGQQAGFLTGPLYTVYKAVSAVALARHLERELGVLVLPVFWIASEDHDWAEANHAVVLDRRGRSRRFELGTRDLRPLPMSLRRLEGDLAQLCDEVMQAVGAEGDNLSYVKRFIDPYRHGGTVAGAFGEALGNLLGGLDLFLVDAADPVLKEDSVPVLREALVQPRVHEGILRERSRAVVEAGYGAQVAVLEGATNVFHHGEEGRHRLYRRGSDFLFRERRGVIGASEMLERLEEEPGKFSPNVFLRPVVESRLFPTLAYVGGPGELAYFAQVSALFPAFGMASPIAVPRFSGDVVDGATERLIGGLQLDMEDLDEPRETLVNRLARREMPPGVEEALEVLRADVVVGFERLMEFATGVDGSLVGALGADRNRILSLMGRSEWKVLRSLKRREVAMIGRLDRVLDTLRPSGLVQDRVVNVASFLGRYGPHFMAEVERAVGEEWRLPS